MVLKNRVRWVKARLITRPAVVCYVHRFHHWARPDVIRRHVEIFCALLRRGVKTPHEPETNKQHTCFIAASAAEAGDRASASSLLEETRNLPTPELACGLLPLEIVDPGEGYVAVPLGESSAPPLWLEALRVIVSSC